MDNLLGFPYNFNCKMQACIQSKLYSRLSALMASEPGWAATVRKLRIAKGLSQGKLAEQAGLTGNTLSNALNGKTSPRLETLESLVSKPALDCPLWRLFVDDRQADLLDRQQATDAAVTNESDVMARIEQRLLGKAAANIKEAIAEELRTGQSAALPAKPLPVRAYVVPSLKRGHKKRRHA